MVLFPYILLLLRRRMLVVIPRALLYRDCDSEYPLKSQNAEKSWYNFILTCGTISHGIATRWRWHFQIFCCVVNLVNAPFTAARSGHYCLHAMRCNFRVRLTRTRVKWPSWLVKTLRDWIHTLYCFRRRKSLNRCLTHDRNHWWVFDNGL